MRKTLVVLLALTVLLSACGVPGDRAETFRVDRVVDGDTIVLANEDSVRYIGVNTPERGRPFYKEAKAFNQQLVEGKRVRLVKDEIPLDQYGRVLAYVFVDGTFVNMEMVRQGYANAFTVPPNDRYAERFRQAEREARENERGLWARAESSVRIVDIQADAPGTELDNLNQEWVEIANAGTEPVSLGGYSLKDEATNVYTFPDVTLAARESLRLHTGQGQNRAGALYWGSISPVWNNDGDTAFLRDFEGDLVDVFDY